MLPLIAIAVPIDPVVACQATQEVLRPCAIRPESMPDYLEEYENGLNSVPYRSQIVWVTGTRLRSTDLSSGACTDIDLDADGNMLKVAHFERASDTLAHATETYFYQAGRLDSVTTKHSSSYTPGDTSNGTVYLRDGLVRKKTERRGYPSLPVIYMLSYWYAGETPGSIARPASASRDRWTRRSYPPTSR